MSLGRCWAATAEGALTQCVLTTCIIHRLLHHHTSQPYSVDHSKCRVYWYELQQLLWRSRHTYTEGPWAFTVSCTDSRCSKANRRSSNWASSISHNVGRESFYQRFLMLFLPEAFYQTPLTFKNFFQNMWKKSTLKWNFNVENDFKTGQTEALPCGNCSRCVESLKYWK